MRGWALSESAVFKKSLCARDAAMQLPGFSGGTSTPEEWETGWAGVYENLHPCTTALTHKRWVYGKCTKNVSPLWFLKKKRLWAWFIGFSLSFDRTTKPEWLSWAPDTIPIQDFSRPEATFAFRIVARQHPKAVGLKHFREAHLLKEKSFSSFFWPQWKVKD